MLYKNYFKPKIIKNLISYIIKELWKKKSTDLALDHFDDFYGSFYGKHWPSVRLSLLTAPKYCALVNYYGDYEATIQSLRVLLHSSR